MKKILTAWCMLLLYHFACSNQLKPGDTIPGRVALPRLNGSDSITFADLRGKVVVIECWATWCSPCVSALSQMEKLQKRFAGKLVVLAVSKEPADRLKQFIANRPTSVNVVSDTGGLVHKLFPHRTIPHTIIADAAGKVVGITSAQHVSQEVIAQVIAGKPVHLPLKEDRLDFDPVAYFCSDTTLRSAFVIQPGVPGVPMFTKSYPNTSFAGRRITIINATRSFLFRLACGMSAARTINRYEEMSRYDDLEKFCIDVWVSPDSAGHLNAFLGKQLAQVFFDVHAAVVKRPVNVCLIRANSTAIHKLKKSEIRSSDYVAGGSFFKGDGVQIAQLADYLENFGIAQMPVLDCTGLAGHFDIAFSWQPEKRSSLLEALEQLGLYLEEAEQMLEVLMIDRHKKRAVD